MTDAPAPPADTDLGTLSARGLEALAAGDTARATELLREVVRQRPDDDAAHGDLGLALEAAGDLAGAAAAQLTAIGLAPGNPVHHYNLGTVRQAAGDPQEAARHYVDALEREPAFAEAYFNLATLFFESGQLEIAAEHYRNALVARTSYPEAASNLGLCLRRLGRLQEAVTWYAAALELRPDLAVMHANLGIVLAESGRFEEAIGCFGRALAIDPQNTATLVNLSLAWRSIGRPEIGGEYALRAAVANPAHTAAHVELGSVCAALKSAGRTDDAEQIIRRWRRIAEDHPVLRHTLAALGEDDVPHRASDAYVTALFDASAPRFDETIMSLGYQVPGLVSQALEACFGTPAGDLQVLDAGCGTGLLAPVVRPYAKYLEGVDLSEGMLQQAARRGTYDMLERQEIVAHMAARPARYDLVLLGEVLLYFGDLASAVAAVAAALRPGGTSISTIVDSGGPDFQLMRTGQYAHGSAHVRAVMDAAGLTVTGMRPVILRHEAGKPVEGWLVTATRGAAATIH